MKLLLLAAAFLFVCLLALAGCFVVGEVRSDVTYEGSGTVAEETRALPAFRRVEVEGSADVVARVGPEQEVRVRCDDNLISRLVTEVRDRTLVVRLENGSYHFRHGPRVELTVPALESVGIEGSGDATVEGLAGGSFEVGIAGSGSVRASGRADRLEVEIAGSGDVRCFELEARTATVEIAGSGDVELDVRETLDVSIAGSGDVRYRGDPRLSKSIAGSGDVTRR